jgi:hypothetical protein
MAIQNQDQLVAAFNFKSPNPIFKTNVSTKGAGSYHSHWRNSGLPGAAPIPAVGTGQTHNDVSPGSFDVPAVQPGQALYLGRHSLSAGNAGFFFLCDRLWSNSGLNGTLTTAQVINSLPIRGDGVGVEAWLEFYTATGATAVTATMTYTNTQGQSGRTATAAVVATTVAGQLIPFVLQTGDLGIQSIQSLQLSATTGTAGNFGITLLKRMLEFPIQIANAGVSMDFYAMGGQIVNNEACLFLAQLCTANTSGTLIGSLDVIPG